MKSSPNIPLQQRSAHTYISVLHWESLPQQQ